MGNASALERIFCQCLSAPACSTSSPFTSCSSRSHCYKDESIGEHYLPLACDEDSFIHKHRVGELNMSRTHLTCITNGAPMSLLASRTSVQSLTVSCLADLRTVFSVVSPSDVPNTELRQGNAHQTSCDAVSIVLSVTSRSWLGCA